MLTDTAPLRYSHYHKPSDTPDKVRFDWLEKITRGLACVVSDLTSAPVGSPG